MWKNMRVRKILVVTGRGRMHGRVQRNITECTFQECQVDISMGDLVYTCIFLFNFKAKKELHNKKYHRMLKI